MGDSNVGLGMVPCRKGCRCDECKIDRLRADADDRLDRIANSLHGEPVQMVTQAEYDRLRAENDRLRNDIALRDAAIRDLEQKRIELNVTIGERDAEIVRLLRKVTHSPTGYVAMAHGVLRDAKVHPAYHRARRVIETAERLLANELAPESARTDTNCSHQNAFYPGWPYAHRHAYCPDCGATWNPKKCRWSR